MKSRILLLAASLLATTATALADGFIIVHRPPPLPHPRPEWHRPHPVFAPLEVTYHKVEVAIDGQKATTRVDQEFFNRNDATLEGEYLFPIPAGAHIDRFTMRVGDRDLEAELLDADKARRIYEDIVRHQRDPALLEYTGRGAFRVRIYPIEPHSSKRVQLTYTELLKNDGGVVSYIYPLNTEKFSAQPLRTASVKVDLRQPAPIKALYSPSHMVEIRREGERRATIGWETSDTRPDRDFQVLFSTAESEVGINLITHRPGNEDGTFVLLAAPGAEQSRAGERPNPKDVIFVLDTSGSMAGRKLEQARKALTFCVENLNDADRFEVLRFATETEACFDRLVDAGRANRARAREWIDAFKPIGGTAIDEALQRAVRMKSAGHERPFVVIFLTDGQPTIGETDEDRIVASVAPSTGANRDQAGALTRIFCFGIGTDVNTHLLDKIAERTRAATQFVLPEEDLELKVSSFFTKIKEPLLTNLKITWPDGVRVSKTYPQAVPDLFRGDQLVLTGRYAGSGEGDVVIEGLVNGRARRIVQRVRFSQRESGNAFVEQLWATRRVGWLLDEIRLRGESAEVRAEVVELARRHAIVTPYTSYLIVEDEARRAVPLARRTFSGLESDKVALDAFGSGYRQASTEKSGGFGTHNARANSMLKNATSAGDALAIAQHEAGESVVAGAAPAAGRSTRIRAERQVQSMQQNSRVVQGKAFYQNGTQWIDGEVQQSRTARTVRVQFASEEYFKLLAEKSESAAWLALGRNVQFTLGDTLYDVFE